MVRPLLDTNILVDHLRGHEEAREELRRYPAHAISIITWMEIMVGTADEVREATIGFLRGFSVVPVDDAVALRAVEIRRAHRIRLPDAIIWATAQVHGMILVTRNTKDFPGDDPGVRVPYLL